MAKNQFIRARVANWEKFVISENARKARMTESEFVRRAALEKNVVVINGAAELLTELRRQDIKQAMELCYDREQFIRCMEAWGYGVKWEEGHKHITYTTPL